MGETVLEYVEEDIDCSVGAIGGTIKLHEAMSQLAWNQKGREGHLVMFAKLPWGITAVLTVPCLVSIARFLFR
jgi:hypothetical protein